MKEIWICKICGASEEIDITKPIGEIGWEEIIAEHGYDRYCPKCKDEREFECRACGKIWKRKELVWQPSTDADELGVYVVYLGYTPCCYEIVNVEFGYKTSADEPLRHEW